MDLIINKVYKAMNNRNILLNKNKIQVLICLSHHQQENPDSNLPVMLIEINLPKILTKKD